jgi:N4-gp56 family major capsid protein
MVINQYSQFTSDIEAYIADELLALARRQVVAYGFGDALTLPEGRGLTYTATRYNRLPLPFAPLSEGVPPTGQAMTLTQVTATAQQWGDKVTITDVAELTIKHPLFKTAVDLCGLAVTETLDRNTFNSLMAGTQVNYVNSRGSRASLVAGDVMNVHEVHRITAALYTIGAPRYSGDENTTQKIDAENGEPGAGKEPRSQPHYVAIMHPLVEHDIRETSTVLNAWSYSDVNKLYNDELGELAGVRFCRSNMVPFWTGVAAGTATPGTSGSLATDANYRIIVTGSDTQNQYESLVYQVVTSINVTGPNGSITLTTPSTAGYTWNVYIGKNTSPVNLGVTASGPTTGPLAGQAVQLPGNTAVTITNIGTAQVPPAAPATGVTVYPCFFFGRGAYGQVVLEDVKTSFLTSADKSDPLNQQRVVGWKVFYATIILNQTFFARTECASAFSATFG